MASLDSLEPRTPTEAALYLDARYRRRLDGYAQRWTLADALAVRVLLLHFRTKMRRAK